MNIFEIWCTSLEQLQNLKLWVKNVPYEWPRNKYIFLIPITSMLKVSLPFTNTSVRIQFLITQ
jgi:hypothetical protein